MRLLVTGGAGFIGSHVCEMALAKGWQVFVVDNLSTGRLENVHPDIPLRIIDILSPGLTQLVMDWQIDAIAHLAAQVNVEVSLAHPDYDASVNVLGTLRVLEAARQAGVTRLVLASSAAVYGSCACLPVSEQAPLNPISMYGAGKAAAEGYLQVYRRLQGLKWSSLRFANVYGPRQRMGVIASFIKCKQYGEKPLVYGNGNQTRDFVFVSDIANAVLQALGTGAEGEFNIGSSYPVTINSLAEMMGLEPDYCPSRLGDIQHSCLDIRKAVQELTWKPQVELRTGLEHLMAEEIRFSLAMVSGR